MSRPRSAALFSRTRTSSRTLRVSSSRSRSGPGALCFFEGGRSLCFRAMLRACFARRSLPSTCPLLGATSLLLLAFSSRFSSALSRACEARNDAVANELTDRGLHVMRRLDRLRSAKRRCRFPVHTAFHRDPLVVLLQPQIACRDV